jgi:hypothetical protein
MLATFEYFDIFSNCSTTIFECGAISPNCSQLLPAEGYLYVADLEIKGVEGWIKLTVKDCPARINIKYYSTSGIVQSPTVNWAGF